MPSKDSATKFIFRHLLMGVGIGGLIAAIGGYAILVVSGEDPLGVVPGAFWLVVWLGAAAGIGAAVWFGGLFIFGAGLLVVVSGLAGGRVFTRRSANDPRTAKKEKAESRLDP